MRRSSIIHYPLGPDRKEITSKVKKREICNFHISMWTHERDSLDDDIDDDIITKEGGRVVKVKPAVHEDNTVDGHVALEKLEKRLEYVYSIIC